MTWELNDDFPEHCRSLSDAAYCTHLTAINRAVVRGDDLVLPDPRPGGPRQIDIDTHRPTLLAGGFWSTDPGLRIADLPRWGRRGGTA